MQTGDSWIFKKKNQTKKSLFRGVAQVAGADSDPITGRESSDLCPHPIPNAARSPPGNSRRSPGSGVGLGREEPPQRVVFPGFKVLFSLPFSPAVCQRRRGVRAQPGETEARGARVCVCSATVEAAAFSYRAPALPHPQTFLLGFSLSGRISPRQRCFPRPGGGNHRRLLTLRWLLGGDARRCPVPNTPCRGGPWHGDVTGGSSRSGGSR